MWEIGIRPESSSKIFEISRETAPKLFQSVSSCLFFAILSVLGERISLIFIYQDEGI